MIDVNEFIKESLDMRQQHLNLSESCCHRGGNSTNHKGVLAQYLGTTIPGGRILLCHACHDGLCSNPKHLYWGTDRENHEDAKISGQWHSPWDRMVEKYGYEEACRMNSRKMAGNTNGEGNRGRLKSEEHRKKISESLKSKQTKSPSNAGGRNPSVPYETTIEIWKELGLQKGAEYFKISKEAFKSRVMLAKKRV